MEEHNIFLLKIVLHIGLISSIIAFVLQTRSLVNNITFPIGYIILGAIAIISVLYYVYKIFGYVFEYRERHAWHPSPEMMRDFYNTNYPVKTETKPVIKEKTTRIEPITERIDVSIKIDPDKGLFYAKNLDIEEKIYLTNHKYEKGDFVPIGKTRQEECWVKANGIESLAHTFLVQNIKQEILKYTKDVKINLSIDPDLIFKNNNGEIVAIEVETGTGYGKHRNELEEKFLVAKERYKKNLNIVLTDSKIKYQYTKLFKNIKILTRQEIPALLQSQFPQAGKQKGRHSIPAKAKHDTGRKNGTKR